MAVKTTLEQLEEVQAAITATLKVQAYNAGDMAVKHARLSELRAYERELEAKYAAETGGRSRRVRASFEGGVM